MKMLRFVLPCVLFAACGDEGLHDYVNDHVIGARFSSVQDVDGLPVGRLPSGEIFWADNAETPPVLRVILDNPRRTVYGVTYSGNGASFVQSAAQDPTDLSSVYIELAPADDVVMRVVDGHWYGDISINVRLIPPAGKVPPDDIFLSILRKYPGNDNGDDVTSYADGANKDNVVAILKTGDERIGYATLAEAVNSPYQGGAVILVKSVEIADPIDITTDVLLVANPGQTLTVTGTETFSGSLFTVKSGATFTFCGDGSGEITLQNSTGSAVTVEGTFNMEGGVISNNKAQGNGGGVYVSESGSFTMSGGSIRDNDTARGNGGGVYVAASGSFKMSTGGSISGNTASGISTGGGVYVAANGSFTMSTGGSISGNEAYRGGGVYVEGSFEMSAGGSISGNPASYGSGVYVAANGSFKMSTGGSISDNEAYRGGGVYVEGGTFTMKGGSISDNTANGSGGGVYVAANGSFEMSTGGSISGNTAKGTDGGGGVYVEGGIFTMEGGSISGNTATGFGSSGGGVSVLNGTFTMEDGSISGNTAIGSTGSGGGVYVASSSTFTMNGGSISGNTTTGDGGGVYLYSGTFTKTGGTVYGEDAGTDSNTAGFGKNGAALYNNTVNPPAATNDTIP
jgi:parallel beta-helix repeat protein